MNLYTVAELAYLAGIIDGEGSIYIGNFSSNPKTGALYYQTNMEVTNTDEDLIKWLLKTFGGRSNKYTAKQTPKNSRKPVFRWIAAGELLTKLCHEILPYLVIKRHQCEIMIKMRATFIESNFVKGMQGTQSISEDIMKTRKSLFDEIRAIHCRNYNK